MVTSVGNPFEDSLLSEANQAIGKLSRMYTFYIIYMAVDIYIYNFFDLIA